MSIPLHFPAPRYVSRLMPRPGDVPLEHLCERAGVRCRASGDWTHRRIRIVRGKLSEIVAEASPRTAVQVTVPSGWTSTEAARYALAALAYSLMDGVARASIRGVTWARARPGAGRPRTGRALNTRERQRRYRAGQ